MAPWGLHSSMPSFQDLGLLQLEGKGLHGRSRAKLFLHVQRTFRGVLCMAESEVFLNKHGDNSDTDLWQSIPLKQVFPSQCQHEVE
jgi:hypothetical protein